VSIDLQTKALLLLFEEDEIVGFREPAPTFRSSYNQPTNRSEFFCINPLIEQGPMTLDNVACYRNILVECDKYSIETQFEYVTRSIDMPYTTCTYSGGKSLHFVIRLADGCKDEQEYNEMARMVFAVVKRCDTVNVNPNRLTRLPEALRYRNDPQEGFAWVLQSLISVKKQEITKADLINWAQGTDAKAYNRWLADEMDVKRSLLAKEVEPMVVEYLSATTQQLVFHGAIVPGRGRHEALQKAAAEMLIKGYPIEKIETYLYQAQDKIGLERDDVPGLLRWCQRKKR